MRQVILDTETTGLEVDRGHRVIEIGCVEIIDRRKTGRVFHRYLQPDRAIDNAAVAVHGITSEFLATQPRFPAIAQEFMDFVAGAELIVHNASFDVAFLDAELARLTHIRGKRVRELCQIVDTLLLARQMHPGQRNSLDALCKRYDVDNSRREMHGALLDAHLLVDVYLAMTGGQRSLSLDDAANGAVVHSIVRVSRPVGELVVIRAAADELEAHERTLAAIDKASRGKTAWRTYAWQ
jgi:DNA polymerase-3 subunit epsilon